MYDQETDPRGDYYIFYINRKLSALAHVEKYRFYNSMINRQHSGGINDNCLGQHHANKLLSN